MKITTELKTPVDKYLRLVREYDNKTVVGIQYVYKFPSGYGVSVIKKYVPEQTLYGKTIIDEFPISYGCEDDLWEAAIVRWTENNFALDSKYDDDLRGHLTDDEVSQYLVETFINIGVKH